MNAAMICSTFAKLHGVDADAAEFMPKYGPQSEPVERTDEDLMALAIKANALMGGKVVRK